MRRATFRRIKFHAHLRNVQVTTAKAAIEQAQGTREPEAPVAEADSPTQTQLDTAQLAALLESMAERLDDIERARFQNLDEMREIAIELSVAIASHLLKKKLDAGEFQVEELVRDAIEQLLPAERISVKVNPADLNGLAQLGESAAEFEQLVDLSADPKLPRGACFVGTSEHGLLSSLESRLEHIRETLLQGIPYARTERRKPVEVDAALRRFPDRRKLA